jgi:mono/diheme cytochrome c family protein
MLACGTSGLASDSLRFYGFEAASYSPTAQEGLAEIFAGRLFYTAVPTAGARLMIGAFTAAQKGGGFAPDSPEGRFYTLGRLPSPPTREFGSDAAFGLGESVFARDNVQHVNINCFTCHAGVVRGQVVAGLGNNHINQSEPQRARTRGDNFGPYAVWRLGSRLEDPANKGLELAKKKTALEALIDSIELPPVDPMPWWLMKYKKKDYWYADAAPDDAASFSINFTTPHPDMNAHHEEHVQLVSKALAFARETVSPPFPGKLDAALVQQGADLFHGRVAPQDKTGFRACTTCHGSYTKKSQQSDLSEPGSWSVSYDFSHMLRNVNTDKAYNTTLQRLQPVADHLEKLGQYLAAQGVPPEGIPHVTVPKSEGYVAPPLVGVWASAPYFHNGSVPTIEAVLDSSQRPEIWSRDHRDPFAYDLERVGMAYKTISRAEFDESAARADGKPLFAQAVIDHTANYDTLAFGHGNQGHTFGDRLTAAERRAIIEFLKSLSGPDM